jgi:hypothetical protein
MNQKKSDEIYFKVFGVIFVVCGIGSALIVPNSVKIMTLIGFIIIGAYYWVKGVAKDKGIETLKFP